MTKIVVRIEGHYEVQEAPFSRSYYWHPALVTLECDCGEKLTLTAASTTPTCRCGVDHSAIIRDPEESPWRYNEVTSVNTNNA